MLICGQLTQYHKSQLFEKRNKILILGVNSSSVGSENMENENFWYTPILAGSKRGSKGLDLPKINIFDKN